jgi:hypothetical protein
MVLLNKIQEYCYDNQNFLKNFNKIVLLFYKTEVLSEEVILKWYKDSHSTKGWSVFMDQMKKSFEWLKQAESDVGSQSTPTIVCFGGEKESPGLISYNRHNTCYHQNGILPYDSKSRFEVSSSGRYFVSMSGNVKNYQNNRVVMKMVKVEGDNEVSRLWPYVDHEADHDSGFTGGSPINGVGLPFLAAGNSIKTYLDEADGDSKITSSELVMFKLPSSVYVTCGRSEDDDIAGIIRYNNWCSNNGVKISGDSTFTIQQSSPYFICFSAFVKNYEGTYFEMSVVKDNTDFTIMTIASQHRGKASSYASEYSGGGSLLNCRIQDLDKNDKLVTKITDVESNDKLTKAYFSMFKLSDDSWFNCINGRMEGQDGRTGLVTFTWCGGNFGVEDVNNKHDTFKITKSGKYYISLTAYIKHYEGGFFAVKLKRGDSTVITLESDHKDDGEGFTGGGNVYKDNIWKLYVGDVLTVSIATAEDGSKLTTAGLNMFILP